MKLASGIAGGLGQWVSINFHFEKLSKKSGCTYFLLLLPDAVGDDAGRQERILSRRHQSGVSPRFPRFSPLAARVQLDRVTVAIPSCVKL